MEACCCISHLFARVASSKPNHIAIVEANAIGVPHQQERSHANVPLYEGDVLYTFAQLHAAVNSLSARIVNILHAAHDPQLCIPITSSSQTPIGHSLELDKSYISDGCSCIGHEEGERTFAQNDVVYKHIHNSVNPSEDNMEQHVDHSSSPRIIGIYIGPSAEYVVAILAVIQSGGAFLPIDPSWPKQRVLDIVSSSNVSLIISCNSGSSFNVHENHENKWLLEGSKCSILCLSYGYFKGSVEKGKSDSHMTLPCQSREPRSYCYVMYTSGSSGKPKGVCGTEKGLLNRFMWMETLYPFLAHDISCFKTAISFIDHLSEILGPILSSTILVIPSFQKLRENPLLLSEVLKAYHITRLISVPSLIRALLPDLQSFNERSIRNSLRVLVLSGETFPIWLWEALHETLVETTILNLYGTTEVSGDCTYFDCKALPKLLEVEILSSVPIGKPILGCKVLLATETNSLALSISEGEIWVGGECLAVKYLDDPSGNASNFINLKAGCRVDIALHHEVKNTTYFKTGDFARKLSDGNYVFHGRKDRIIKINGQRIALEEIEYNLRKHPCIADAAASVHYGKHDNMYCTSYIVLKETYQSFGFSANEKQNFHSVWNVNSREQLHDSLRSWLEQRLPTAMIPSRFSFIKSLPLLPSGKIDYVALPEVESIIQETEEKASRIYLDDIHIQRIKQVYKSVLMVEEISDSDDLFSLGGNSISAAHVAHALGVDMHMIYKYPSPIKLYNAVLQFPLMLESIRSFDHVSELPFEMIKYGKEKGGNGVLNLDADNLISQSKISMNTGYEVPSLVGSSREVAEISPKTTDMPTLSEVKLANENPSSQSYVSQHKKTRYFEVDHLKNSIETAKEHWDSSINLPEAIALTRCNKIISQRDYDHSSVLQNSHAIFRNQVSGTLCQIWKVLLHSCVDASPLLVVWNDKCYIFIGSHAHNFLCIDAYSGEVQWEAKLGGRVESTAAVINDFSQVVVGCYNGTIYFLAFLTGEIIWSFQTGAEVKSQPIVDKLRGLIWCGSHDHNLYALDPKSQSCVFKLACGGSIFGAPVYDKVRSKVYVATTSGRVVAVNLEGTSISFSWLYESRAPIFGPLAVETSIGYVICSLVNGNVIALSPLGNCIWQARTEGPVFAGACISPTIPSQVLVCSRDGFVYAFDLKQGSMLWKHLVGEPITSSAYVDETIELVSQCENQQKTVYRLVCVCSSSGTIYVLKVDSDSGQRYNVAASADLIGMEEESYVSVDHTKLTQTEGETQDSSLKEVTDMTGNCEDQNLNVQLLSCQEFAKVKLPGEIFSSPVMYGGRIFIGCRDDHVYCISINL